MSGANDFVSVPCFVLRTRDWSFGIGSDIPPQVVSE